MCRVACEKQIAEPHRLSHEATQGGNALLDRSARLQVARGFGIESASQFLPKLVVKPILDVLVTTTLQVVAASAFRPH